MTTFYHKHFKKSMVTFSVTDSALPIVKLIVKSKIKPRVGTLTKQNCDRPVKANGNSNRLKKS